MILANNGSAALSQPFGTNTPLLAIYRMARGKPSPTKLTPTWSLLKLPEHHLSEWFHCTVPFVKAGVQ